MILSKVLLQAFDYVPGFLVGSAGYNLDVGSRNHWGLKNSELRASFSHGRHSEKSRTSFAGRLHVLKASNNDVKLAKLEPYILHDFKSSFRFETKDKPDRDDSYWQILLFVYPLEYNVTRKIAIIPSILRQSPFFSFGVECIS